MATHSSVLALETPRTEEPGGVTVHRVAKSRTRQDMHTVQASPPSAAVVGSHRKQALASGLSCRHAEKAMRPVMAALWLLLTSALITGARCVCHAQGRHVSPDQAMRECVSPDHASLLRAVPGHKDFIWADCCLSHYMHLSPSNCLKRHSFGHERYLY